MSDTLALAKAMFPDSVEFRFVYYADFATIRIPGEIERTAEGIRFDVEIEHIQLHTIAEGIRAGMSEKTHIVFIYEGEDPDDNDDQDH